MKTLTVLHPFLRRSISSTSYFGVVSSFSHCQNSLFKETKNKLPVKGSLLSLERGNTACSLVGLAKVRIQEPKPGGRWVLMGTPTIQVCSPVYLLVTSASGPSAHLPPTPDHQTKMQNTSAKELNCSFIILIVNKFMSVLG